jgi:hypothetical protein
MAQGGRKTPPNNRSPVITHSRSYSIVVRNTTTTFEAQPIIHVEPTTLLLQRIDVQEIIRNSCQSIIRTQGTLDRLRQFGEKLHRPLDFSNQEEDILAIGTPNYALRDILVDPSEALILGVGGSGLPPSPPDPSPLPLGGESSDEDNSSSESSKPLTLHII